MLKLQTTLISSFMLLFFNNVYAITSAAADCNQAYEQGNADSAIALAQKALTVDKNDRDALICQGRSLSAKSDLNGALLAFKTADTLSADALDRAVIALITGHAYKLAMQFDQAILSYQQAVAQAQTAKYNSVERMSQLAIGDIHFNAKQYDKALAAYLASSQLDANDNERAESDEKIAITYHITHQHDLALEYQIKAFLMNEKSGTLDQYANSSIELGRYYAAVKNYVSAESTLKKIIQFAKDQGGAYFEAKGSCVLAQVKAALGDNVSAKALVTQAKLIAKNTNDKALEEEIKLETQHLF